MIQKTARLLLLLMLVMSWSTAFAQDILDMVDESAKVSEEELEKEEKKKKFDFEFHGFVRSNFTIEKDDNVINDDFLRLTRDFEQDGFDYAIECCGEQDACDQGIELLKPGGKLIIAGIPSVNELVFNPHQLRRKEISIQNVRRQNNCMQRAINMASRPEFSLQELVTHNFDLEQVTQAFELVSGYQDGVIKAVVNL